LVSPVDFNKSVINAYIKVSNNLFVGYFLNCVGQNK